MTNAEALTLAENLLALGKRLKDRSGGLEELEAFADAYGRLRPLIAELVPRQMVEATGSSNAVATYENLIEAGFLSGSGSYEHTGYLQLLQFVGRLRDLATADPQGPAAANTSLRTAVAPFVDSARLDELRRLPTRTFDVRRLVRLCEELNIAFASECFHAVALVTRALLDHVPPIFGVTTFAEVANNHGSKSFKESMGHLQNSARKIADGHLHTRIRKNESLPNATQVNFSRDLDVLLGEIVRVWS